MICKNFEGLALPLKGQWIKKWTMQIFFDISSTNIATKIWQNSISGIGMSFETRMIRLMKKRAGVKKSRWTVPWMCFIRKLQNISDEYHCVLQKKKNLSLVFSRISEVWYKGSVRDPSSRISEWAPTSAVQQKWHFFTFLPKFQQFSDLCDLYVIYCIYFKYYTYKYAIFGNYVKFV